MENILNWNVLFFIFYIGISVLFYYSSKRFKRLEKLNPNKNKLLGDIGERLVAKKLLKLDDTFQVRNSIEEGIYINRKQIDHLVINTKYRTVYVIETKNWHGKILGSKNDNKWTQQLNGKTVYYNNPVKQNEAHCEVVADLYKGYEIKSIIVFTDKDVSWQSKCKNIIRLDSLIYYIKQDIAELKQAS